MIDRRVADSGLMRRDAFAMPRAGQVPREGCQDELQWQATPAAAGFTTDRSGEKMSADLISAGFALQRLPARGSNRYHLHAN